ncbi:UNVERIFIED_CONTAM: HAD hydrolase, family IIID protein [Hammondia hammondi]|eukprot:XP_008886231.1 HAD hydrolase, family IIID protein [Hammondia hammondi]
MAVDKQDSEEERVSSPDTCRASPDSPSETCSPLPSLSPFSPVGPLCGDSSGVCETILPRPNPSLETKRRRQDTSGEENCGALDASLAEKPPGLLAAETVDSVLLSPDLTRDAALAVSLLKHLKKAAEGTPATDTSSSLGRDPSVQAAAGDRLREQAPRPSRGDADAFFSEFRRANRKEEASGRQFNYAASTEPCGETPQGKKHEETRSRADSNAVRHHGKEEEARPRGGEALVGEEKREGGRVVSRRDEETDKGTGVVGDRETQDGDTALTAALTEEESRNSLSRRQNESFPSISALDIAADDDAEEEEEELGEVLVVNVKWGGKLYNVSLSLSDFECFSLSDFKEKLQQQLSVPADKQKLLGFTNAQGYAAKDTDLLSSLRFKKERQMMLIGSTDAQLLAAAQAHAAALAQSDSILDDFLSSPSCAVASEDSVRTPLHLERLEKAVERTRVQLLHAPRKGKKLLVLDLDYTLFDCKSLAGSVEDLKRPFLDRFMEDAFEDYDLAVWSQTHWKWVEMKCTELGFLTSPKFHLCFVLDRSSMFTVCSRKKKKGKGSSQDAGVESRTHEVKALELIWRKFPEFWNASNTVHVDDLSRNFFFNPQNGIKVSAYRREKRSQDRELLLLSVYLKLVAQEADVRNMSHKQWRVRAAEEARRDTRL